MIAYTLGNAYAEFEGHRKGILIKGKFADSTLLSQDIFSIPADKLPATQGVLTIVEDKIVYERKALSEKTK